MFDTIWNQITSATFINTMGLLLYWLPLAVCLYEYVVRTVLEVRKDLNERKNNTHYHPRVTVGTVVGHVFVSICPVVNVLALIFDVAWELLKRIFSRFANLFDIPLVPKRKEQ